MPKGTWELTRFILACGAWLAGLASLGLLYQVLVAPPLSSTWSSSELAWRVPGILGLLLPFTALAGGLSLEGVVKGGQKSLLFGAMLTVPAYALLAHATPISVYQAAAHRGEDMRGAYPLGPSTPGQLRAQRAAVRLDHPEDYSFRRGRPLETPPNWLSYLLHSPAALAFFAILGALVGHRVGFLTSGLSPPARRNARWVLGLAGGLAFFVAEVLGGEWVRLDPGNSGLAGAWLPLLVPLIELALLGFFARRCPLHGGPGPRVL